MPPRDLVHAGQVGETGRPDLTPVWPLATVRDEEDTHLSLGCLNGAVGLTGWHCVTLAEEQEVVNKSLHVLLHSGARGRCDLVVLNLDGAGGHVVEALVDDAEGLAELLHTAKVAVVAVTVDTNGDVEVDPVVGVVWLRLTDIPRDTGSTEHDAGEGVVDGIGSRDDTNTLGTANPDTVISQHLLGLVDAVTELSCPLVDVVEQTNGEILRHATRADVGSVKTGTRDTLVEFLQLLIVVQFAKLSISSHHELLTLLEAPQERCQGTDIHSVGQDGHEMVQNPGNLAKQSTDVLGTDRDVNVQQLLNSEREALLVGHHRDVVETVEVGQGLQICAVLNELLGTAVQQTDVGIGAYNLLSVELEDQTQHTVGSGMLGPKVDGVVTDLAGAVALLLLDGQVLGVLGLNGTAEVFGGRDHAHALAVCDLSIVAGKGGGQRARNGSCREGGAELGAGGVEAHTLGGVAGQTRNGDGHGGRGSLVMPV